MIDVKEANMSDLSVLKTLNAEPDYFEKCFKQQKTILIVFVGSVAAGYGFLNWVPRYQFFEKMNIPEIQDLYVIPEYRKQGAATAMIRYCEVLLNNKNCNYVGVSVALHKDAGYAQRLYTKLGYIPDGNGVTYDRESIDRTKPYYVDDDLCLMLVKEL